MLLSKSCLHFFPYNGEYCDNFFVVTFKLLFHPSQKNLSIIYRTLPVCRQAVINKFDEFFVSFVCLFVCLLKALDRHPQIMQKFG